MLPERWRGQEWDWLVDSGSHVASEEWNRAYILWSVCGYPDGARRRRHRQMGPRGGDSCSVTDVHDAAGGGPKRGVSNTPDKLGDTLNTVGPLRRTQKVV